MAQVFEEPRGSTVLSVARASADEQKPIAKSVAPIADPALRNASACLAAQAVRFRPIPVSLVVVSRPIPDRCGEIPL